MTPLQLRSRLEHLERELGSLAPEIYDEIKVIKQYLTRHESGQRGFSYAEIRVPWMAIAKCLDEQGDFKLDKAEVRAVIINGGYKSDADGIANDLIRDAINYHIRSKRLEMKGELLGRTLEGRAFKG